MTASRYVTIWCDGKDAQGECDDFFDSGLPTAAMARKDGREGGWAYRAGRDLCPLHARGGERRAPYVAPGDAEKLVRIDAQIAAQKARP